MRLNAKLSVFIILRGSSFSIMNYQQKVNSKHSHIILADSKTSASTQKHVLSTVHRTYAKAASPSCVARSTVVRSALVKK